MNELKWWGTGLCLVGIALTSFNIFPLNIIFGFIGSGLWTLAGYLQKDMPLFLVEFVATIIYAAGIISYILYTVIKWGLM